MLRICTRFFLVGIRVIGLVDAFIATARVRPLTLEKKWLATCSLAIGIAEQDLVRNGDKLGLFAVGVRETSLLAPNETSQGSLTCVQTSLRPSCHFAKLAAWQTV